MKMSTYSCVGQRSDRVPAHERRRGRAVVDFGEEAVLLPAAHGHVRRFWVTRVVNRCHDNNSSRRRRRRDPPALNLPPGSPTPELVWVRHTSHSAFLQGLLPPETRREVGKDREAGGGNLERASA